MTAPSADNDWLLEALRHLPTATGTPLADWWQGWAPEREACPDSHSRALLGGLRAPAISYAFAAGYQSALRALAPELADVPAALCVTEAGSGHPRDMNTALLAQGDTQVLTGHKDFITMADMATTLLVLAVVGAPDAPPPHRFSLLAVPADAARVELLPDLAFVPEVRHGRAVFDQVQVLPEWILPGDGYQHYVKPFRGLEDAHVMTAVLGCVMGSAIRLELDFSLFTRALALANGFSGHCAVSTTSAAQQAWQGLQLDGLLRQSQHLFADFEQALVAAGHPLAALWQRDKALFRVAEKARNKRLQKARALLHFA